MKILKEYSGLVALVILAILNLAPLFAPAMFGATGTRFPNGISADSTSPVAGELRGDDLTLDDDAVIADDVTINGGSLTVTTGAGATSTVTAGCINYYATSSATVGKLVLVDSATSSINGTAVGLLGFKYGSCP